MYSLGFASRWEVPLAPFLYRLASPCILLVYCGGLGYCSFLLIYCFVYLSKKIIYAAGISCI